MCFRFYLSDVRERATRQHRSLVGSHVAVGRELVALLEEKPGVLLAALQFDQRELAAQLLAMQHKLDVASGESRTQRLLTFPSILGADGFVCAFVPNNHAAGAVVSRRNDPLERAVVKWMIFDHHGEPTIGRVERRT